ncbi:MAG: DoxX family protein [Pseudomonadota bacterium]
MDVHASQILLASGRIALASLFILGALNKVFSFTETTERMVTAGLPLASVLLPAVIALEMIGGLIIASGLRIASWAGLILAVYTLAVNAVFHRFWEMQEPIRALELSLFFKNISIAGGLLVVAALALSKRNVP